MILHTYSYPSRGCHHFDIANMSELTIDANDDQTLRNVKPIFQDWGRCVGQTGLVLSLAHLIPIKSECYLMPSAYVDGGGHMVANQIKSTHKYVEHKLGVTKMPWGLLHTLCVDQKILSNVRKDLNVCDGNPFKG